MEQRTAFPGGKAECLRDAHSDQTTAYGMARALSFSQVECVRKSGQDGREGNGHGSAAGVAMERHGVLIGRGNRVLTAPPRGIVCQLPSRPLFSDNRSRVKCPKCHYLGFETGDRCKHCGYDFSLLTLADSPAPQEDLLLHPVADRPAPAGAPWADLDIDAPLTAAAPATTGSENDPAALASAAGPAMADVEARPEPASSARSEADAALPLFPRPRSRADEPRVKLPATPRPPVAVRRTPDTPRLKAPFAAIRPLHEAAPPLNFPEPPVDLPEPPPPSARVIVPPARTRTGGTMRTLEASGPRARATAALIDLALLGTIDLAVLYFTLAMAGLTMAEWRVLPMVPLLAFLVPLKFTYFAVFTAFGGQTIGKMAAHIRVVADDDTFVEPARALQRTAAAIGSVLTFGAGFVPALVSPNRRALHDRVAHTRVVVLPST
jgi:uncharacterized RDD family membrane protein YckC